MRPARRLGHRRKIVGGRAVGGDPVGRQPGYRRDHDDDSPRCRAAGGGRKIHARQPRTPDFRRIVDDGGIGGWGGDRHVSFTRSGCAGRARRRPGRRQVGQHEGGDDQHHQCLRHRVVLVLHGLHEEPANAVQIEHLLGDDEAADQKCRLDADQGHHRQQRVLQRVAVDDNPLDQALGPCGADIVFAQHFEHCRAGHAHRHRGGSVADGQRRKDHHRQIAQRVLATAGHSRSAASMASRRPPARRRGSRG